MPRSACFPLLGWKPGNICLSSGSTIQCHRLLILLLRRKSKSIIDYWQSFNNNNNVIIIEWNLPNTRLNRLAPLWMFAAWLETCKSFCLSFFDQVKNKSFVFVSLSSQEDHLSSPCLCILDYQAQIRPVINRLRSNCFHFSYKSSSHSALHGDQPECAK